MSFPGQSPSGLPQFSELSESRGQLLVRGLGQLVSSGWWLMGVLVLFVAAGLAWVVFDSPGGLAELRQMGLAGLFGVLGIVLPVGMLVGSVLVVIFTLQSAQRAITSADIRLSTGRTPAALPDDMRAFQLWLSVWQWGTLVVGGLNLVANVMGLMLPGDAETTRLSRLPTQVALPLILVIGLASMGLTWLVLTRIKAYVVRLTQRLGHAKVLLAQTAQALAPWLQTVEVLFWIGLVMYGISGALTLLGLLGVGLTRHMGPEIGLYLFLLIGVMAVISGLVIWSYLLSINLLKNTRLFAQETARQLDEELYQQRAAQTDRWDDAQG